MALRQPSITDDAPSDPIEPEDDPARARSLVEDIRTLASDAARAAGAEFDYQKARAGFAATRARGIVVFGALAGVLAFFALMALVVGLLLALTPLITAWGATAVVVGLLAVGAFVLAKSAARRWERLTTALGGQESRP